MKLKAHKTSRGFRKLVFEDQRRSECSLQESSLASEKAVWLGCEDASPSVFIPHGNPAWRPLELPELPVGGAYSFNTRMHLTQKQVKKLLPVLKHFAKTGELPDT